MNSPVLLELVLAKSISKYYNLLYLDTGKIYRLIALIKINQKKFNIHLLKKIKKLNLKVYKIKNCYLMKWALKPL